MKRMIILLVFLVTLMSCNVTYVSDDPIISPHKALLVMNMQLDALGEDAKMPIVESQIEDLIETINTLTNEFYWDGYIIIYIKTVFSIEDEESANYNNAFFEDTEGVEFDPRVKLLSIHNFEKNQADAFSNEDFENFLKTYNVDEIFLTGLYAETCVYTTIIAAVERKYKVNYIENAVGTQDLEVLESIKEELEEIGVNIITYEPEPEDS